MSDYPSQFSERPRTMNAASEAARLLQLFSAPHRPGESVKSAIYRAARKAGISAGLCKRLWYKEARRIDADLMDSLRERAAATLLEIEQAENARQSVWKRLERCEQALGLLSQDEACSRHPHLRGQASSLDRTLDVRAKLGPDDTSMAGAL